MSVQAPEKSRRTRRQERRGRGETVAPPFGFSPPEIVWGTRVKRHRKRRRRAIFRAVLSCLLAFAILGTALLLVRNRRDEPPPSQVKQPGVSALIAWAVHAADRSYVSVIAIPPSRPAVVLAVPGDTQVDSPAGGPSTVEEAGGSAGALVAAAQATLGQRIPHYLVSGVADFQSMVDRVEGIPVLIEEPLTWEGRTFVPGDETLGGGAALEYLEAAPPEDATGRWEGVLAGVLSVLDAPGLADAPVGVSDDLPAVLGLLLRAKGAPVLELPTAIIEGSEGRQVDTRALRELRLAQFPGIGGTLIRVIVLNGNGQPGIGTEISTLLATSGYRVVASQNLGSFDTEETQVIAATTGLLGKADEVRGLLGLGRVYVGTQPTGIADITIVVGKDYSQA